MSEFNIDVFFVHGANSHASIVKVFKMILYIEECFGIFFIIVLDIFIIFEI